MLRLKSFFVGGLCLLMLGLFPTFAWASEEVRSVEMSVAAVKQYYRDRDYVSLFDALVFAGGEYTKVMRPSEIFVAKNTEYFNQIRHLEPVLSKVDRVYFPGRIIHVPAEFDFELRTPIDVLSSGGAVIIPAIIGEKRIEKEMVEQLTKVLSIFPQEVGYKNLLSANFVDLKRARQVALVWEEAGNFGKNGWFSCTHLRVGHALDGTFRPMESASRLSAVSAAMHGGISPHPIEYRICLMLDVLSVVGLHGSTHPKLKALHVDSNGRPIIGPELQCALDLLYHPKIQDGMQRSAALFVLRTLKEGAIGCD